MHSIVDFAWRFADGFCVDGRAGAQDAPRHPTVFVGWDFAQPGTFCLDMPVGEEAARDIRALKAEIQQNKAQLNIRRINVSVVVRAGENSADVGWAGQFLRTLFEEDFPIVHLSLFILLSESNVQEDFEARSAAALSLLRKAEDFPFYNLIWLFSDRNERDTVSAANMQRNLETIAFLHSLNHQDSRFEDSLRQKSRDANRRLFVSAGMAQLQKPDREIAFAVFRRVFSWFALAEPVQKNTPGSIADKLNVGTPVSEEKIAREMESIAANNVKGRALHKMSIREAEAMLFGDRVRLFYEANFTQEAADIEIEPSMLAGESFAEIQEIESRIASYTQEIEQREQGLYFHKPFQGTQRLREAITEIYTVRSRLERLHRLHAAMTEIHRRQVQYRARREEYARNLEEAEASLKAEVISGLHIAEYYEQAVNRILDPLVNTEEFETVEALAEHVADFVKTRVMTQPEFCLSFEEDLLARAALSPDAYDRDFTNKSKFYSKLLEDAEEQAALGISLKRYDDLIYEKYYLGDTAGPCMEYAREHAHRGINEAVYFVRDAAGFKLLRLAGGFAAEDLTRYSAMERYSEGGA